jgi:hypothetical protein
VKRQRYDQKIRNALYILVAELKEGLEKTTAPYWARQKKDMGKPLHPVRQNIAKMLKTAAPYWAQEKKDVGKQLHPIGPYISTADKLLYPTGPNKSKVWNIYVKTSVIVYIY